MRAGTDVSCTRKERNHGPPVSSVVRSAHRGVDDKLVRKRSALSGEPFFKLFFFSCDPELLSACCDPVQCCLSFSEFSFVGFVSLTCLCFALQRSERGPEVSFGRVRRELGKHRSNVLQPRPACQKAKRSENKKKVLKIRRTTRKKMAENFEYFSQRNPRRKFANEGCIFHIGLRACRAGGPGGGRVSLPAFVTPAFFLSITQLCVGAKFSCRWLSEGE